MVTPIEQELKGIDGINVIRSTAYSGTMQITIEVDPNFKDRSRLVSDIQQAINRADLPVDLPSDPIISEIKSEQTPVLTFSIFGDFKPLELKHLSDKIEDDVRNISGVANVFVQGDRKEEIRIIPNPGKMHRSRVSINDIISLVQGWNVNAPGGRLKAPEGQSIIRITGEFVSAEDAGNLVLRANEQGQALRLKDVAEITETLERSYRYVGAQGDPAINMIVIKKGDADIIDLVDRVRAYLDTIPDQFLRSPDGGLFGGKAPFHMVGSVFADNDRIVHHQAKHHNKAEHHQQIQSDASGIKNHQAGDRHRTDNHRRLPAIDVYGWHHWQVRHSDSGCCHCAADIIMV